MKTISLLFLGLASLIALSLSSDPKNTRVLSWTSQAEYISQISNHFLDLFNSIRFKTNKYTNIKVEEGTSHLSLYNVTLSSVSSVIIEDGVFQYDENCASSFRLSKNVELKFNSDGVYFNGENETGTFSFSVFLNELNFTRDQGPDTYRLNYNAEYKMALGAYQFLSDLDISQFIDDVKEDIVANLRYQDINTIFNYAIDRFSANDILTLDLDTDELPDNQSRKLILERSENGICNGKDTGIVEAFSAQISDYHYQSENISFAFDSSKANSSQIFYDLALLNDLVKSKVENGIFTFEVTEKNARDFVNLGWTAYDLMTIFPNILYYVRSSNTYALFCSVNEAFSQIAAGRLVNIFSLNCQIVITQTQKYWMDFTAQLLMDLKVENDNSELVLQVDKTDIIDFYSDFTDIYYVNLLKKEIQSSLNNYLNSNNYRLFRLSKEGYQYEYVDGKGILLYK